MSRPRLLDLFCCQGGAAKGYHDAGFDVVGVDVVPQPRYPFEFVRADALTFLAEHGSEFDAIHASPPCQDHSTLKSRTAEHGTGWLLDATLTALEARAVPWVVENVMGARMGADMVLCGSMFGLRVYRHRKFRIGNVPLLHVPPHPRHVVKTSTKKRRACWEAGLNISMTGDGLSQAIPPAYSRFIGEQLRERIEVAA